jgi:hypothetical protein
MSAETHEVLRKLPLSKLGVDLACAVLDHHRGEDAVRVVCALINLASVMSGKLSAVDQTICALVMHDAAADMLPEPRAKPVVHARNGQRISLVK